MNKKLQLILTVAVLGLLSATAMWYVQRQPMGMNTMYSTSMPMGGVISGGEKMQGILPGEMDMYREPYPTPYYPMTTDALDVTDRSIQKSASHSVVVDNVAEYMKSTQDYLKSVGGVIISYNQGTLQDNYVYGNIYAKVPVNAFEGAIDHITQNVKKVVSATIDAQDITGDVVSADKRINSLEEQKSVMEAYLEDATTAAEKKKIQLQIDQLTKQIERAKIEQQNVEDRVDFATVNIAVSDREYYFNGNGPRPFGDVFREAWFSLRSTGFNLAYFLIWVVVYAIIWVPVLLLARWIWGKVRPAAPKTTTKR